MLGMNFAVRFARVSFVVLLLSSPTRAQQAAVTDAPTKAALQLASIFSDHMVLQREQAIPIWGTANPSTLVRVQLGGKTREATSDAAGKWRIDMGPLPAGGPLEMKVWTDGAPLRKGST